MRRQNQINHKRLSVLHIKGTHVIFDKSVKQTTLVDHTISFKFTDLEKWE